MSDTDRKQREECPGCEWHQQHREDYFHGDNQYYFSTWTTAFKQLLGIATYRPLYEKPNRDITIMNRAAVIEQLKQTQEMLARLLALLEAGEGDKFAAHLYQSRREYRRTLRATEQGQQGSRANHYRKLPDRAEPRIQWRLPRMGALLRIREWRHRLEEIKAHGDEPGRALVGFRFLIARRLVLLRRSSQASANRRQSIVASLVIKAAFKAQYPTQDCAHAYLLGAINDLNRLTMYCQNLYSGAGKLRVYWFNWELSLNTTNTVYNWTPSN
jgi:hypothetical protein